MTLGTFITDAVNHIVLIDIVKNVANQENTDTNGAFYATQDHQFPVFLLLKMCALHGGTGRLKRTSIEAFFM